MQLKTFSNIRNISWKNIRYSNEYTLSMEVKNFIKRIFLLLSVLMVWHVSAQYVNPLFVPEPKIVFLDLIETFKNGILIRAIGYSFLRITFATFVSAFISVPIGLLVYNSGFAKV